MQFLKNKVRSYKFFYPQFSILKDKQIVIEQTKKVQQEKLSELQKQYDEETDLEKGKAQMFSQQLPEVQIQSEQKVGEIYVDDYTKSVAKLQAEQTDSMFRATIVNQDGQKIQEWDKNTAQQLDLRENPLALQILSEGEIDLTDKRISVISTEMNSSLGSIVGNSNLKEINLGRVEVLQKNSINIRDVDVNNIPDDLDIQLDQTYRELRAVGLSIQGDGNQRLERKIIEDVTFQDFKDQNLFKFEQHLLVLDKVELIKKTIRRTPLYIFYFAFFQTIFELYHVRLDVSQMEDQEYVPFQEQLEQAQKQMLTRDERFNRSKIQNVQQVVF